MPRRIFPPGKRIEMRSRFLLGSNDPVHIALSNPESTTPPRLYFDSVITPDIFIALGKQEKEGLHGTSVPAPERERSYVAPLCPVGRKTCRGLVQVAIPFFLGEHEKVGGVYRFARDNIYIHYSENELSREALMSGTKRYINDVAVSYLRMSRRGTGQAPPFPPDSSFLLGKRRYR